MSQTVAGPTSLAAFLVAGRRHWVRRTLLRGAGVGLGLGGASALVLLAFGALGLVPAGAAAWLRWLPPALLLTGPLAALVRALAWPPSDRRLALRAEEVSPELEHLPSVALELPDTHPYWSGLAADLSDRIRRTDPRRLVAAALAPREALAMAGVTIVTAGALLLAGGPASVWASWGAGAPHGASAATHAAGQDAPPTADALAEVTVRVTPPAYTGLDAVEEPLGDLVAALAGSTVEVRGPLSPGEGALDVRVIRGEDRAEALDVSRQEAGGWNAAWRLGESDRGLVISATQDGGARELVVPLDVRPDAPPMVELLEPARDMVLATGNGEVTFRARATDPFGVADFRLTWVHTRGSGESFDFREGAAEWATRTGQDDDVEGTLVLRLPDLPLGPGDVLHLRAVASDHNDVTGPGTGVSVTRQIRVIREGDEMAVDALVGFPLEVDEDPILSQRMILLMTEDLLERRPTLSPTDFRSESERIAREQARLRAEVGEQVYSRATGAMESPDTHLGHGLEPGAPHAGEAHAGHRDEPPPPPAGPSGSRYGVASIFDPSAEPDPEPGPPVELQPDPMPVDDPAATRVGAYTIGQAGDMPTGFGVLEDLGHAHDADPVLSVNQPLLAIHDAMWASEGELRIIDPEGSIPHQESALEGLQALRENTRVFPRGRVTVPPVDVEGVRGSGEVEDADPAPRSEGSAVRTAERWAGAIERLLTEVSRSDPSVGRTEVPAGFPARVTELAVDLLGDPLVPADMAAAVARAGRRAEEGDPAAARDALLEAYRMLDTGPTHRTAERGGPWSAGPTSVLGALRAADQDASEDDAGTPSIGQPEASPFVFATLRYESGNWDSAPLVPQNLIHSLAQYTELPVAPEGVTVDLSSREIFAYPVLYLTGHLPVRFSAAEADNLRTYVERGGFVFMDDHNHDIDGAFHRTATAEIARIFGDDALEALPSDHELYRTFFHFEDGPPLTSHELSGWGDGLIHPELHAVLVDGRIGLLYSNKDYSSEWSYHAVNKRFLAVDNTRFGVNILLYALTR